MLSAVVPYGCLYTLGSYFGNPAPHPSPKRHKRKSPTVGDDRIWRLDLLQQRGERARTYHRCRVGEIEAGKRHRVMCSRQTDMLRLVWGREAGDV